MLQVRHEVEGGRGTYFNLCASSLICSWSGAVYILRALCTGALHEDLLIGFHYHFLSRHALSNLLLPCSVPPAVMLFASLLQLLKAEEDAPMAADDQAAAGGEEAAGGAAAEEGGGGAAGDAAGGAAGEGAAPMETSES